MTTSTDSLNEEWYHFVANQQHMYDPIMQSLLQTENHKPPPPLPQVQPLPCCDDMPSCEELVISTKTKCLYLSTPIPIYDVFWNVPVLPYSEPAEGVIKKQTKIICDSEEAFRVYQSRLHNLQPYQYEEKVIKFVDNTGFIAPLSEEESPDSPPLSKTAANRRKLKYKNERKLTIGMSKKDVLNVRRKEKQGAFYNCVALTLRILYGSTFYEFHAKVFNTGKIEVPGKINRAVMDIIKQRLLDIMQPFVSEPSQPLHYVACKRGVLINSGFKCGFYIDRDKIYHLLRNKYGIEASYDSCSYQGVKCKFYFNHELGYDPLKQSGRILEADAVKKKDMKRDSGSTTKYTEVAFMIFRTGSVIIVGNCSKRVLYFIYEFIKHVLRNEYREISMGNEEAAAPKKKKTRKMYITLQPIDDDVDEKLIVQTDPCDVAQN